MTRSVAQPTCVAPCSRSRNSSWSHEPGHAAEHDAVRAKDRRPGRVVGAEELVGRVDEVDSHGQRRLSVWAAGRRLGPAALPRRLPRLAAGGLHGLERALPVALVQVDGPHRLEQDERREAEPPGVERRGVDAVVRREAADDDRFDAAVTEDRLELGGLRLAGDRVAGREPGVAVLAVHALAHPGRVRGRVEVRVELGAPRVRDAVDRPDARRPWRSGASTAGASPG